MKKLKKTRKKAKRISIGKLKEQADRALQDWYRRHYPNKFCEMCNVSRFYCMHHFITKASSNFLRYDTRNLVFVCKGCHSKFHKFIEPTYPITLRQSRGLEWVEYIEERRYLKKYDNRKELEKLINYYENN